MSFIEDFRSFALRGNMIDMAVGFTVGAAFTTIAKSLVDDIVMPFVGLGIGKVDFSNLYFVLKQGKMPGPYDTLAAAKAAGAVTINWGLFLNNVIAFMLIALAMFFLLRGIQRFEQELENHFLSNGKKKPKDEEPTSKKCKFCLSTIAVRAVRCAFCTSELPDEAPPAVAT
jgi:large conductance mechanosensitive channel